MDQQRFFVLLEILIPVQKRCFAENNVIIVYLAISKLVIIDLIFTIIHRFQTLSTMRKSCLDAAFDNLSKHPYGGKLGKLVHLYTQACQADHLFDP